VPASPDLLDRCPIEPQAHRSRPAGIDAIRIWPRPSLYSYSPARGWRERPADLLLGLDHEGEEVYRGADALGWDVPLGPLLLRIPEEIRAAMLHQPAPFSWPVMQLLHDVPEALALADELPSLVALLAGQVAGASDHEVATAELREELAPARPVLLLPLLGLPPERRLLDALAKTDPGELSIPGVELRLRVLVSGNDRVRRLLLDLPQLRGDVLVVLDRPRLFELATDELLRDPADGLPLWMLLEDLAGALDAGLLPALGPLRSRRQLDHVHGALRPLHERASTPASYR